MCGVQLRVLFECAGNAASCRGQLEKSAVAPRRATLDPTAAVPCLLDLVHI
jgi:hypothetical protein